MTFRRNVICRDIKADAGCLTETACVTHGDPAAPGLRAPVELWSSSRIPAAPRRAAPRVSTHDRLQTAVIFKTVIFPLLIYFKQACYMQFSFTRFLVFLKTALLKTILQKQLRPLKILILDKRTLVSRSEKCD